MICISFFISFLSIFTIVGLFIIFNFFDVLKDVESQALVLVESLINHELLVLCNKVKPNNFFRIKVEVSVIIAVLFDRPGRLD